jgi:twitching motility protein PilT
LPDPDSPAHGPDCAEPAHEIAAAVRHALASTHAAAMTDLILHEGQAIRVKSARGTVPLHQLCPAVPPFAVTREHLAAFLAGHACGPGRPCDRDDPVDPEHARRRPLSFRLEGPDGVGLRCNLAARSTGELALVMRLSPASITPLEDLALPPELLQAFTESTSGFLLVTGPTGAGKSETAMSVLDWHNARHSGHLLTVEDPVEKKLIPRKAVVTQQEVGVGMPSFAEGLRAALRMSPDILYASDIADADTAMQAIQAGESGSLMIAGMSGRSATGALRKILGQLGPGAEAMRPVLAGNLVAVVRQALVPARAGDRYFLAADVLYNTGRVTSFIEKGDWLGLEYALRQDHGLGTGEWSPMNTRLAELVERGEVDAAEAMRETSDIPSLRRRLSGISPFPLDR